MYKRYMYNVIVERNIIRSFQLITYIINNQKNLIVERKTFG